MYSIKPVITRALHLFIVLFAVTRVTGQIQHINFRHYSLADGLSSYKVVKVLQDRFGFMWIATQDGLNRFDGKGITIYNKSATEKHLLAGSDITDMVEDTSRNMLWVISSYGGLNGIDIKTGNVKYNLAASDTARYFSHEWLKCIVLFKNELWIGTFDGITIINPDKASLSKKAVIPFQKNTSKNYSLDINLFYKDEYDRVWAFIANYGLTVFSATDHSAISSYDLSELHLTKKYKFKSFYSTLKIGLNQLLLATCDGLKKISYSNTSFLKTVDEKIAGADTWQIHSLQRGKNDNIWFATDSGLLNYSLSSGKFAAIKDINHSDQKNWLSSINSVFTDNQGNLWLSTLYGFALATNTHSTFLNYFQSPDLKTRINRAYYIFPYNDSSEYVCAEDGFFEINNITGNIKQLKSGMAFSFIYLLPDGNKIVSAENHLFIFYPPGNFTDVNNIYPELSVIKNETINSAVSFGDSLVIIGSESGNGVYEWNYKSKVVKKIDTKSITPLKSDIVNIVYKDKSNNIWILSDNNFSIYDPINKKIRNFELTNTVTGQSLNLFFDVCETSGSYWLASYGSGIVELDKSYKIKRIISTRQGIANAGVYKIFPVDDTLLYVTSNNGFIRINIMNYSVWNYFETDGLHSNAFEEGCGISKDGKIYAGGPNGFSIIYPKNLIANNIPPHIYINRVVINAKSGMTDTSDLLLKSLKVPNDVLQATVYFSGINYSNPERNTYSYRIKEQHSEWVSLGNQNTFSLSGLSHGVYTLEIKAANENGIWSDVAELELTFLPKWYQTWWFRLTILTLLATILYLFYNYRLSQIKKVMDLRIKISQDLHDEIGSSISGIGLLSQIADEKLRNNKTSEASEYLFKINNYTQDVIEKLSDMVWIFNPQNDSIGKLLQRLKSFTIPIAASKDIKIHFAIDKETETINLSIRERKAIYLISKEAINNIFKYAECKTIYYSLHTKGSKWQLVIQDDGKGFLPSENKTGNGIKNMQARAGEIPSYFDIQSAPGSGTIITVGL